MNKLLFLLALIPLLLVLPLNVNAQLPFLPNTGNLTHLPIVQPATNLTATGNLTNSNSNLTAAQTQNSLGSFMDKQLSSLNREADSIKTQVSSAVFTPGNGKVIELINSLSYMRGEISALGAGYSILHSAEDALISKIKAAGPSAFSPGEQSYITSWVNDAMTARQNENNFASLWDSTNKEVWTY